MNDLTFTPEKLKALIVDDEITNRVVLKKLLNRLGYEITEAENGKEAIEKFSQIRPDIVFMDVMMPIMNGHTAAKEIKKRTEGDFVPIIFLTALSGSEELQKCIDAGGDDFLSKPFDMPTLNAKIHSMERISKLYRHLQLLNGQLKEDDQFAKNILSAAIFDKNEKIDIVKTWFQTGKRFNNDLLLTSYTPSSGLNILFGHFNVEGTAAAVGALPTSEVFRAMTKKGYAPHDIVDAINKKLCSLLPASIYLEAIFVNINQAVNGISIANFGMPEAYISSPDKQKILHTIEPCSVLLGTDKSVKTEECFNNIPISEGEQLVLARCTLRDEESNLAPEFSRHNLKQIIENVTHGDSILDEIKAALIGSPSHSFTQKHISIVQIPLVSDLTPDIELSQNNFHQSAQKPVAPFRDDDAIKFELGIQNQHLRAFDPIPALLNFLDSVSNIEEHRDTLFTVFTEFFVNALDHGILGLDSSLKSSPDGFFNYFVEREKRLKSLTAGSINIKLLLDKSDTQHRLKITFTDSGPGFDYQKILSSQNQSKNILSGRGYLLIKNLCEELEFEEPGNSVTALYSWPINNS